ncbi:MAG: hypothetical protein J5930_00760 [Treponema sp.]|nr:hypothetical protein [Treponema sp.]
MTKLMIPSVFLTAALILFAGCSGKDSAPKMQRLPASSKQITPKDLLQQAMDAQANLQEEQLQSTAAADASENKAGKTLLPEQSENADPLLKEEVDLDLTTFSANMAYSEVFNMMLDPESYVGQKIRINGENYVYQDDEGNNHYACIILDATGCCPQGLEYQMGAEKNTSDYPADAEDITLVGTFELFKYQGYDSFRLGNARFIRG